MQKQFSQWLDAFRWLAAFAVLISHSATRLLDKVQNVDSDRSIIHYAYQFFAGFSHPGVMVFFVLSGFFVGGSALSEFQRTGDVDLHRYFVKRVVRLSLVLWPALLVTAAFDAIGDRLSPEYAAVVYQSGDQSSLLTGVCNAAYINTLACPHFGSNVVLWSLANEFWYYLLFPLALLATFSKRPAMVRGAFGLASIGIAVAFSIFQFDMVSPMLPYFSIWLLGVWASSRKTPILKSVIISAATVVGFMLAVRVGIRHEAQQETPLLAFALDAVLAMLFANMLVAMRFSAKLRAPPAAAAHVKLADFSYSLYCIHVPALLLYIAVVHALGGDAFHLTADSATDWLFVFGGLGCAVLVSYIFSRGTEARTASVRDWLYAVTSPRARLSERP